MIAAAMGCGRGGGPPGADSGARPHPRSGSYGSEPAAAAASAVNKPQARHFRDRPLATANGFPGPVPTANAGGGCRRFRGPASPALPTPAGYVSSRGGERWLVPAPVRPPGAPHGRSRGWGADGGGWGGCRDRLGDTGFRRRSDLRFPGGRE
ncbi:unnamed protein product [Rangifer tarandus platyrhynchus]|uniref:Uncharacterized protein n=1 Tax=Rangifer tarandus platyrhynchus TaxID=3082113 RepID=A0AC59ZV30_RANTA